MTPDLPSRFDRELRKELHHKLLVRGSALATLLGDVLADKDRLAAIAAIGVEPRPGIRPEELLRDALNQVERRRRLLDAGDDRYGRCDVCGVELSRTALEQLPWADRCQAHATHAL